MKTAFKITWILLCLALALAARCWNLRDVFLEGKIYFVDADCYSRMTRARMVDQQPGTIVRHHDFENWPQGVFPHTTAPLDYLIVGLKRSLDLGFAVFDADRTSVLRGQTLDLAGAAIAPLLGLGGMLFLGAWCWRFRVRYGGMALLIYAISPILVHGTLLGRPDHQCLLIFLLTIAAGCEMALAATPVAGQPVANQKRVWWGIMAGAAWALSLWVSLYEPLMLLVAVGALWMVADRRAIWAPERRAGLFTGLAIVAIALLVEGWRIALPDAAARAYFSKWAQSIGEMAHLDLRSPLLFGWLGWAIVAAPVLLFLARKTDRRALAWLALLAVTFGLTLWQVRWGYFLALVFAWSLPWQMEALRRPWVAWLAFSASLWPVLKDWDARLFPEATAQEQVAMQRAELAALRDLAMTTSGQNAGAVLAPWWLSPAVAYWTGNPCVAGSSHQSLPGIVDSARFFLSPSADAAAGILRARRVRWVLADEPQRVIATSASLLGVPPPATAFVSTLMEHPGEVPDFLEERDGSGPGRMDGIRFYRLYRVDDAKLPQ